MKNFEKLIGNFDTKKQRQIYQTFNKHFEPKRKLGSKDWLTKNDEKSQSYNDYV